ncbi:hypothetical protein RQP50_11330 [Paenibacillus sp. chi10]|uniref:Uncharacterized protein n=1 Tax=Paenibacillus suaedae TaxID=3077233 RepID=A0AAJ2JVU2_9BACL|nr:hypothetical protein [Paenibacillus sp. chi10]MDT8976836.1 hypothetical protein [Paenibacillus sp. chi10]
MAKSLVNVQTLLLFRPVWMNSIWMWRAAYYLHNECTFGIQ